MKLIEHFNEFSTEFINLNQSRIDLLETRVNAISGVIKGFDIYSDIIIRAIPQGSWAHRTIIRPARASGSFDADLVVFVNPYEEWAPGDYIDNLYDQFKGHGTYADKVSRKTRCVSIDYAGEFSIDVVPCIIRSSGCETTKWIINHKTDMEEQVNPDGYIKWFLRQNEYLGDNHLIKTVRIIKYLRDFKLTFSAKSILLTTLIGGMVSERDIQSDDFSDFPTSLRTLINRLNAYLQQHESMPNIVNPVLSSESFTRHWDKEKYENFRRCISRYAEWIEDAYIEEDFHKSVVKWRKVFGNGFAKSVVLSRSEILTETHFEDVSHVVRPPWNVFPGGKIKIIASFHSSKEGDLLGDYYSDGPALDAGTWIHFTARHSFVGGVAIKWQVVNTGWAAKSARCLRGGFDRSGSEVWECSLYRGKHWIECFAVDLKRNVALGRSGRFYVNIS